MNYPNFKNKHLGESVIHPSYHVEPKGWHKMNFPKKWVIAYQDKPVKRFVRKHRLKEEKLMARYSMFRYKRMGLLYIKGIGSPNSVSVVEDMIALKGKEFINTGIAGGLHSWGLVLCTKALRDEGTSHHYVKSGKYAYPDKGLTDRLRKTLKNKGVDFIEGASWTIDAPYRETREEVKRYAKQGIKTVEMEASALFALAKYRKVKMASLFVVSDFLSDKWERKFHHKDVKKAQDSLIEVAFECLEKRK
jgi:uridine phosphorylase